MRYQGQLVWQSRGVEGSWDAVQEMDSQYNRPVPFESKKGKHLTTSNSSLSLMLPVILCFFYYWSIILLS